MWRARSASATHDIDRLTRLHMWWDQPGEMQRQLAAASCRSPPRGWQLLMQLVRELIGFPRHLSQHVGGFVISGEPLSALVPIENAAMAERTVIQWDKDDLESLGLLKVDVLALGMLTALRRCFDLIERYRGARLSHAGHSAQGYGHLRHDLPRRDRRRIPDRIARADEHAAASAAALASTTW